MLHLHPLPETHHRSKRHPIIRQPISPKWKWILAVISVVILASGYEVLSVLQHQKNPTDTTIPGFTQMGKALVKVCTPDRNGDVWLVKDFVATFSRHLLGLLVGVTLSVVVGIAMGCFAYVEAFCLPILSFLTKVPPTAMLAVFFVLVGTGSEFFIALIAFGVFPILTQAIYQSAKYDVHEELIYKAYTLGASNAEVVIGIVVAQVLPRILESVRLQIGPAMVYLIAAEVMTADVGFGYRLRIQGRLLNMAVVYDYIIILGIAGFLLDWGMTVLRRKLCPWFEEVKHGE